MSTVNTDVVEKKKIIIIKKKQPKTVEKTKEVESEKAESRRPEKAESRRPEKADDVKRPEKAEPRRPEKAESKREDKIPNKTPSSNVDAIITLKRITHNEVYDLLMSGHFLDKTIKKTITVTESKVKISKEFSDNPNAGIFINDPTKKNSIVMCSTNQSGFDYYAISNSEFEDNREKICDWCRIRFTHRSKGMAIAYKEFYHNDRICRIFWIYGCHCDERCALAEIEEEERKSAHLSHLDLPTARSITNFLYYVTTGKNPLELKPRCYWRLLKRNGGSIDDEDEPRNVFKNTGNIYLLPAKTLFEKYEL